MTSQLVKRDGVKKLSQAVGAYPTLGVQDRDQQSEITSADEFSEP